MKVDVFANDPRATDVGSYGHRRRHISVAVILGMLWGFSAPGEGLAQNFPSSPQNLRNLAADPLARLVVTPSTVTVQPGLSVQFAATVTGTSDTAVVWSATGGTITAGGIYTPGETPGTYAVTGTLVGETVVGFAGVTIQSSGAVLDLGVGQDIQAAINALPAGMSFKLKAGIYRITAPLTPKDRNVFTGEAGTILSGARLLINFTQSGGTWYATEQTQAGELRGTCKVDYPRCIYPEDLYIDNVIMQHVATLDKVTAGKWYFDYPAHRIYIGNNPAGHIVETTVSRHAFTGAASNVTIRGMIIEKFANPAQFGAIEGPATAGWTVQDSEIRFNHGTGIRTGDAMHVLHNHVHHNGQMGLGGIGTDVLVQDNEIDHNNTAGFDPGWEAGGTKFVKTRNLIVRGNFSHHHVNEAGLWTDIDNIDTLYENNVVEDNGAGIYHEVSYAVIIRGNTVRRNGYAGQGWLNGAGITISASPNAEVYGNTLVGNYHAIVLQQQARGSGAYGPYELRNVWVHNNTVTNNAAPGQSGLVQDVGDNSYFTGRNNRFTDNTYVLGANPSPFQWMNQVINETAWRSFGQDVTGSFGR